MKLVCISDTHSYHQYVDDIPDGDVLIFAGDFTGRYSEEELEDFALWLSEHPHKYKIMIAGNHDWVFEKNPEFAKQILQDNHIIYLQDSGIKIDGVNFWGSPVQPRFFNWAFNRDRGEDLDRHWQRIPENTDVLITHGPPYGILDTTKMTMKNNPDPNGHVGCEDLRRHVLERVKPKVHIFGHIHSAHGVHEEEGITFINASQLTDRYHFRDDFNPVVFEV